VDFDGCPKDCINVRNLACVENVCPVSLKDRIGENINEDIKVPRRTTSPASITLRSDPQPASRIHSGRNL